MWELSLNVPGLKGYAIGESQGNYRVQENFTSIVFLSLKNDQIFISYLRNKP